MSLGERIIALAGAIAASIGLWRFGIALVRRRERMLDAQTRSSEADAEADRAVIRSWRELYEAARQRADTAEVERSRCREQCEQLRREIDKLRGAR